MVLSDPKDTAMSEALRPSLEEAQDYQCQGDCLDYIAQSGGTIGMIERNIDGTQMSGLRQKDKRIKFAQ